MSLPKTAERLNRILAMLPYVIAHPGTTVSEVTERFGYTNKELLSDLELVFICGLPGYGPGELMEAYVEDDEVIIDMADYFSRPLRLNPAEALGLLAAGMALSSTNQAPPALERAVEKLAATILPGAPEALAVELADEPETLEVLRSAAAAHTVVEMTYMSRANEVSRRDVEPWTVFSSLGNWYLSAYCRLKQGERVFRIERIRDITPSEEVFDPPAELPSPVVRYTPSEDDVYATIALNNRARWVAEYYPIEVVEDSADTLVIRLATSDPIVAARLLLRLGGNASLVEGEEVGASLIQLRETILDRYS